MTTLKIQKLTVDNINAIRHIHTVEGIRFKDSEGRFYCVQESNRLRPHGTRLLTWNVHHYSWDCRYQDTSELRSFSNVKCFLILRLTKLATFAASSGQITGHDGDTVAEVAEYEKWDGS